MTVSRADFERVYATMQDVFQEAAKKRKDRPKAVKDPLDSNGWVLPEWVLYERRQLLSAVNLERLSRNLPAATERDISRMEQMACGHTDYGTKYPLYCAELALGMTDIKP